MPRSKNNGDGRLEEALATLMQNQATLVQNQAAFVAQLRENDMRHAELERDSRDRFARIESLLLEHNRILEVLQNAVVDLQKTVREKIGFKATN